MRGVYTVRDTITGVTAAKLLLHLGTPGDQMIEIISARITCQNQDTSEQFLATLARSTSPTGGDVLTPKPTEEQDQISGVTAKGGNTAITGTTEDGDSAAMASHAANKLGGWEYVPQLEERPILTVSDFLALSTDTALDTSSDLSVEITYREIG